MNDLEMTKLCAEATGLPMKVVEPQFLFPTGVMLAPGKNEPMIPYDPLHNDAQAMALVKAFELEITRGGEMPESVRWWVKQDISFEADSSDINRAIVECVAKMQRVKHD